MPRSVWGIGAKLPEERAPRTANPRRTDGAASRSGADFEAATGGFWGSWGGLYEVLRREEADSFPAVAGVAVFGVEVGVETVAEAAGRGAAGGSAFFGSGGGGGLVSCGCGVAMGSFMGSFWGSLGSSERSAFRRSKSSMARR